MEIELDDDQKREIKRLRKLHKLSNDIPVFIKMQTPNPDICFGIITDYNPKVHSPEYLNVFTECSKEQSKFTHGMVLMQLSLESKALAYANNCLSIFIQKNNVLPLSQRKSLESLVSKALSKSLSSL